MRDTDDLDRVTQLLARRTESEFDGVDSVDPSRYDLLSDMRMNAAGLVRYWKKRAEAEAAAAAASG